MNEIFTSPENKQNKKGKPNSIIPFGIEPKFKGIEMMQEYMNKQPEKNKIKINKLARNSQYLEIGEIEKQLDEIYLGLWDTSNFEYKVIVNEITASIELKVFHPLAHIWLTRIGVASKQIMVRKETSPMEVTNKIQNCLLTVMPALKAECIKNAAKSLGSLFGRNLNRDIEEDYQSISEQMDNFNEREIEALALVESSNLSNKEVIKREIKSAGSKKLNAIIEYLNKNQKNNEQK